MPDFKLSLLFQPTKPDRRPDALTAHLTPIERCVRRALLRQARANQLVSRSNQSKHTGVCVGGNTPSSPLSTRLVFIASTSCGETRKTCGDPAPFFCFFLLLFTCSPFTFCNLAGHRCFGAGRRGRRPNQVSMFHTSAPTNTHAHTQQQ